MSGELRRDLQTATRRAAALEKAFGDLRAQLGRIWEEQLRAIRSEARHGRSPAREEQERLAATRATDAFRRLYLAALEQPVPTPDLKAAIARVEALTPTRADGASASP